jgi:hypothetical protein
LVNSKSTNAFSKAAYLNMVTMSDIQWHYHHSISLEPTRNMNGGKKSHSYLIDIPKLYTSDFSVCNSFRNISGAI